MYILIHVICCIFSGPSAVRGTGGSVRRHLTAHRRLRLHRVPTSSGDQEGFREWVGQGSLPVSSAIDLAPTETVHVVELIQ